MSEQERVQKTAELAALKEQLKDVHVKLDLEEK